MDRLGTVPPTRLFLLEHPAELPVVRAIQRKPVQEARVLARQTPSLLAEQCAAPVLECVTLRRRAMELPAPAPPMHSLLAE